MATPTTVGPSDISLDSTADAVQRTYQRKGFFAMGRHWVWHIRPGVIPVLVFDSSLHDSEVWAGETALWPQNAGEFTVWLQELAPETAYVHMAFCDSTGPNDLMYIRGLLNADGTIAWDPMQVAVPLEGGFEYDNIGICLSFGVGIFLAEVFIVYTKTNIGDPGLSTPWMIQSLNSDGTWATGNWAELTPVGDASWVAVVAPHSASIIAVYTTDNGDILSRTQTAGVLDPEVDTGFDIGADAQKISIVSERSRDTSSSWFGSRIQYVAYQAADWDLYCISHEAGVWQAAPANTIEAIGNFRQANPMLSIMYTGDEDATVDDHTPTGTLYCFWTPTTASPLAEWVTYRVSRDEGVTWTNEAGADAARSWIDESGDGFEVQQSGSSYFHSSEDYDRAVITLGLVYVTHRMPAALRHAALTFDDPDEELYCLFDARHTTGVENLHGQFEARRDSPTDPAPDLVGIFTIQQAGAANLLGIFDARHTTGVENLHGQFIAAQWAEDLKGIFEAQRDGDADLKGIFEAQRDGDADLKGIFIARQAASQDLHGQFIVNQWAEDLFAQFVAQRDGSQDLFAQFDATRSGDEDLPGEFIAQQPGEANLYCIFEIRDSAAVDLLAFFRIDQDYISKGLNVSVYRDLGVIG